MNEFISQNSEASMDEGIESPHILDVEEDNNSGKHFFPERNNLFLDSESESESKENQIEPCTMPV